MLCSDWKLTIFYVSSFCFRDSWMFCRRIWNENPPSCKPYETSTTLNVKHPFPTLKIVSKIFTTYRKRLGSKDRKSKDRIMKSKLFCSWDQKFTKVSKKFMRQKLFSSLFRLSVSWKIPKKVQEIKSFLAAVRTL